MSILDLLQLEILLPVVALFGQRRRAEAGLHPLHAAIVQQPRRLHVVEIFVARDRTLAQTPFIDSRFERPGLARLQACCHEITHGVVRYYLHSIVAPPSTSDAQRRSIHCGSGNGRWTCKARRPVASSDAKSPSACANSSVPNENASPGMGTSCCGGAVMRM